MTFPQGNPKLNGSLAFTEWELNTKPSPRKGSKSSPWQSSGYPSQWSWWLRTRSNEVRSPFPVSGSLLEGEETGLWQVDKIKGLWTSPAFPLFSSPLQVQSQGMYVSFCSYTDQYYLARMQFFSSQWTKHSLEDHPSCGVCSYPGQLRSPAASPRHSQDPRFPLWADMSSYHHLLRAHLLHLVGPCMLHQGRTPAPKGAQEAP